jgi:hypothetical protein
MRRERYSLGEESVAVAIAKSGDSEMACARRRRNIDVMQQLSNWPSLLKYSSSSSCRHAAGAIENVALCPAKRAGFRGLCMSGNKAMNEVASDGRNRNMAASRYIIIVKMKEGVSRALRAAGRVQMTMPSSKPAQHRRSRAQIASSAREIASSGISWLIFRGAGESVGKCIEKRCVS